MKVTVQLYSGIEQTFEQAYRVEKENNYKSIYIYDEKDQILAIFDKQDIKQLIRDDCRDNKANQT